MSLCTQASACYQLIILLYPQEMAFAMYVYVNKVKFMC